MVRVLLFACVLSGCFKPSYDHPACGPNRECPSGFSCNTLDVCERPGGGDDDAFVPKDSLTDTPPNDAMFCLGTATSLFRPCFDTAPSTTLTLQAGAVLNTDVGSPSCDATASSSSVCVIAAGTISMATGSVVRSIGSRALVLAAATTITINGVLDLGAHGASPVSGNAIGPCDIGMRPMATTGGGGAGGSFARTGANGGVAMGSQGITGAAIANVVTLRGGCPGQAGATGTGTLFAAGGGAGGAVYLMAGTSITISGGVVAGGGGGTGGPDSQRAGGAGGGSGGLLGLDAPAVNMLSTGSLLANGGGGGAGSTSAAPAGASGEDAVGKGAAGGGASGLFGGGGGGAGAFGTVAPAPGMPSSGGGGGGGGGIGLIRVIPLSALTIAGSAYIAPTAQ